LNFILRLVGIRVRFVFLALAALGSGFICSTRYVPTECLSDIYPLLALAAIFIFLLSLLLAYSVTSPLTRLVDKLNSRCAGEEGDTIRPCGYDLVSQLAKVLNEYFMKVDDSHLVVERQQAKIVEDKHKLEEVIAWSGSDIELLLSVAEIIQGSGDFPVIASAVLKSMNDHVKMGWSSLFILDDETLKLVASEGLDEDLSKLLILEGSQSVQFHLGEGLSGAALASLEAKVANDGHKDKRFKLFSGSPNHYRNINNLCIVPLVHENKGIGLLMVFNIPSERGFSDENVHFLERVARLLSLAVVANKSGNQILLKNIDQLSGLITSECWNGLVKTEKDRAARSGTPAGLFIMEMRFGRRGITPSEKSRLVSMVGSVIKKNLRGVDLATREGYIFKVFLSQTNSLGTMYLAGRIKDACDALSFDTDSAGPLFTTVAGVASFPEDVESVSDLEESVLTVLDKARNSGDSCLICVKKQVDVLCEKAS
jgi:putative methionine-R-sulfoxide reductase with GAF domain